MKYVNFEKISIVNFLSVGDDPVVVEFGRGLHIITGLNKDKQDRRNGVGKSTIADAIHFAIFGSTVRELKKENIVNNINMKGCHVEVDMNIVDENNKSQNVKIVRMLEPSRCNLYINGEDKTRDSIANTSEYICNLLNTTQEVFQNCVIMTINNTIPFMAKKKVEKRKFIEGIFNLEVFSQMLKRVRVEYNDVKRDCDIEVARFEESEKNIESLKQQKLSQTTRSVERREKLEGRHEDNVEELEKEAKKIFDTKSIDVDKILKSVETLTSHISNYEAKATQINKQISTCKATVSFKNDARNKIGTAGDTCPVCLKPVSEHDRSMIDSEKEGILNEMKDLKSEIDDCKTNLQTVNDLKIKLMAARDNQKELLTEHKQKIKESIDSEKRTEQLTSWNNEIDEEFKKLTQTSCEFDNLIDEASSRTSDIKGKVETRKSRLGVLDVVKFIVSEEGVKSYIVKKILQVFNHKLAYYLNKMDSNCICVFNEYFEEDIIDEKGKYCSYFNFSGAERKNIDLACLFAFMDIRRLQGNVAYNFSVYDELLDSSLDERGVDLVLNILRERVDKYDESIMIISHRKESVKIGTHYKNEGSVIFLEKENGITRRVEFSEATA
mgnify:CR=1 FL=1|tara:strand:+ start:6198 stop:8027 length:1830 start_codon:yes stop_codon:yes gene_type:complete